MAGGHGSVSGSTAMGLYVGAASSETDGETYDAETDFDEFDDWNYQEILSSMYVLFTAAHSSKFLHFCVPYILTLFISLSQVKIHKDLRSAAFGCRCGSCVRHVSRYVEMPASYRFAFIARPLNCSLTFCDS